MPRIIDDAMVEPVTRALLGAIDAGDGGTPEQRAVLRALVAGYWERPDLDVDALDPLDPAAAADAVTHPEHRRRTRELAVLLELCRHPLSEAQVAVVDGYAEAFGEAGPGLDMARALVHEGTARALADFVRVRNAATPAWSEPSLVERYLTVGEPDHALAARLEALHDLPEGSLGWEYVEFYRRHGMQLPGDDPNIPAFFVGHDMNHVIAGYETTGECETALSAFLLAMSDSDDHWVLLLSSLAAYEVGMASTEGFVGKVAVLDREGAAELLADAFRRGSQCTGDFSVADHLAMAHLPLAEVRERYGVPPLTV